MQPAMEPNYWQQKICIITGASAGLGLAVARAFSARGARLVLVARREGPLLAAADACRAEAAEVLPVVADVTAAADVARLQQTVGEAWGGADVLCNCAGRSARGQLQETSPEEFEQLWQLNFLAAVRTTQAFVPLLLQRRGHVVQIGSLASKVAPRFLGGYPASKFALAAYAQQLRLELGPQGLHVLLVCPGPIHREDTAPRYPQSGIPVAAQGPGGGAKLTSLDPDWLAGKILAACQQRKLELVLPRKVRLLAALGQLAPRLGDWLLSRATAD